MAEQNAPIRVGLLGAGTVGSQTARILVEQKDELGQRIGRPLEISGIACLDPNEVDFPWIDKSLLTSDTMSVVKNADIVVELIGGTGVAHRRYRRRAHLRVGGAQQRRVRGHREQGAAREVRPGTV